MSTTRISLIVAIVMMFFGLAYGWNNCPMPVKVVYPGVYTNANVTISNTGIVTPTGGGGGGGSGSIWVLDASDDTRKLPESVPVY